MGRARGSRLLPVMSVAGERHALLMRPAMGPSSHAGERHVLLMRGLPAPAPPSQALLHSHAPLTTSARVLPLHSQDRRRRCLCNHEIGVTNRYIDVQCRKSHKEGTHVLDSH